MTESENEQVTDEVTEESLNIPEQVHELWGNITLKQRRFCLEYVEDGNAARAARAAGYSEKSCTVRGPKLTRNSDIF